MTAQPGTPAGQLLGQRAGAKELRARSPSPMRRDPTRPPTACSSQKREADEEAHPPLSGHWKRNRVTGKGVEMVEKFAYLFDEDLLKEHERVGSIQVHLAAPKQKKVSFRKPPRKKDGDKNLHYASCSPDIQKGLKHTRAKE